MSNSPLIDYTKLSPHYNKRIHKIDMVVIHCMAGNLTVESCGKIFANPTRNGSSNYGIGSDGRIALYVDEENRSWCTGGRDAYGNEIRVNGIAGSNIDHRAITIEVANTEAKYPWPISEAAYKSLINLLVDICQRNGIEKLLWEGDKSLVGQIHRQNMAVHRWFANKACPGDYLYNLHNQIAKEVNARLHEKEDDDMDVNRFKELYDEMRKELQDNDSSSYSAEARNWAISNGLVKGNASGEFNGMWEDILTREQFVTVLYRFAQLMGKA